VLAVVGILGIGTMLREIGIGRGRRP
jgi:hypothetical protein